MSFVRILALCAALLWLSWQAALAQEKTEPAAKAPPAAPAAKNDAEAPPAASDATAPPANEKTKPAAPASDPPATAEQFPSLKKEWEDLEAKFTDLTNQFLSAPSTEEKNVIRGRYVKLVGESEKLLPKLRSATEAAYAAAPGKDQAITDYMIKFLAYETRNYQSGKQDYSVAYNLAKRLIDDQVDDPVLFALAGTAAFEMNDYDNAEAWLTKAKDAKKLDARGLSLLEELPQRKEAWAKEQEIRKQEAEADDLPRVKLETSKGTIVVELFENEAPQTVGNFIHLVEKKYYDGLKFHRVIPGFMAQGGDPEGTGGGGPGYTIYDECGRGDHRLHFRGSLSMAKTQAPDSGGSQFFITYHPTTHLDGKHTVFGRVIEGMEVATKFQDTTALLPPGAPVPAIKPPEPDTILTAEVLRKREHEYVPTKVEQKEPEGKGPAKSGKE
ncbi:MAG TPA: peptidylprolyl isomerase [Pirellulaceae bacterium]|nr:peptidylprolyl isomerase [Pirellulaceae bacterium]